MPTSAATPRNGAPPERRAAQVLADISTSFAKVAGRPASVAAVLCIVLLWAVIGPIMRFSDTWQLIMNTISSIITFVMVFLIQNTQARDSEAMHAKLDTLIAAVEAADDRYIGVERLPDEDIEQLREQLGPHAPPGSPVARPSPGSAEPSAGRTAQ